ncbi:MAG: type I restriction enzyme HsdR N-terminal domain-containing protein [Flavobacteriales bacterium]
MSASSFSKKSGHSSAKETGHILDPVRKKRVRSTPEERVRQTFMHYLKEVKGHPFGLMEVEKGFRLHKLYKRCDILTRNGNAEAFMIVECKAPDVPIDQEVFDQLARYNIAFKVPYFAVTNGREHYACKVDPNSHELHFLEEIPEFQDR